jgi:Transposase DDE domain
VAVPQRKGTRKKLALAVEEVPSSGYLAIIWRYLSAALCEEVFAATRIAERRRKWTLFAMIWFWIALLQSRYTSQTRALLESQRGSSPIFPPVDATPEAFFQKVQDTRPAFFQNLFSAFTAKLREFATQSFESALPVTVEGFPEVYALDGSRLAKVARMLKVVQKVTKAIIPGSMEAVYDLRRGILHYLHFDPDGCVGEIRMLEKVLGSISEGALLLADRYYAKPIIWQALAERGLFMVTRYNRTVKKTRVAVIQSFRSSALSFDDFLVDMGGSKSGSTPVRLRWVRIWGPRFDYTILTNVLDPRRLTPQQLLVLYRRRWSVERMYLTLKEVLNLNTLYNCSPAGVGQQVYATAILYNALRVAQGRIAQKAGITPEKLSPDKLFPTLIEHYIKATELLVAMDVRAKREQRQLPDLREEDLELDMFPWLRIRIRDYLLEKRSDDRRQRRYCKGRSQATSYNLVPGGKKLLLS